MLVAGKSQSTGCISDVPMEISSIRVYIYCGNHLFKYISVVLIGNLHPIFLYVLFCVIWAIVFMYHHS